MILRLLPLRFWVYGGLVAAGVASVAVIYANFSAHHYQRGYDARGAEVDAARWAAERAAANAAQAAREAALRVRAAETARDRAIQERLDALSDDDLDLRLGDDARGVLNAIR